MLVQAVGSEEKNNHNKPVFLGRPLLHLRLSDLVDPETTITCLKRKLTKDNAILPYYQLGVQTVTVYSQEAYQKTH